MRLPLFILAFATSLPALAQPPSLPTLPTVVHNIGHGNNDMSTSDSIQPLVPGSCLYVDQGPGTDTKLCSGYAAAIGAVQSPGNTMRGNWTSGTPVDAFNPMPSCLDAGYKHLIYLTNVGIVCSGGGPGVSLRYTPLPPNRPVTNSLTPVMLGLANLPAGGGIQSSIITPEISGNIFFSFTGSVLTDTAGDGVSFELRWGTGTPPANGDAVTGTKAGSTKIAVLSNAPNKLTVRSIGYVTGLSAGVPVWWDIAYAAVTGGQASIIAANMFAAEK